MTKSNPFFLNISKLSINIVSLLAVSSKFKGLKYINENHYSIKLVVGIYHITLYSIITPLKYHVFENIMENGPISIIFSKVFKTLICFQCCLKIENDVII